MMTVSGYSFEEPKPVVVVKPAFPWATVILVAAGWWYFTKRKAGQSWKQILGGQAQ